MILQSKTIILALFVMIASNSVLAQSLKPIKSVPEAGKVVALTFDDGIKPTIHKQMLKILEQEFVPATFFLVGNKCGYKELIRKTISAGHEIGNHSMTHAVLPKVSLATVEKEIIGFQELLIEDFGYTPKLFRAPRLQYDDRVFEVLKEQNLIAVNATVGTRDYAEETTVEYIIETATKSDKLGHGSIILMHEVAKTVEALPQIIAYYKEKGYEFCTVSDLLLRKL